MKLRTTLKSSAVLLLAASAAQAVPFQFYQESFETPGGGYTTSVAEFEASPGTVLEVPGARYP